MIQTFGAYELHTDAFELRLEGERVEVEPKALQLLFHLAAHSDRVVSKDELLDAVWPDVTVGESVLTRAVSLARQAVGDSAAQQGAIRTYPRRGYRFVAQLGSSSGSTDLPPEPLDVFVGRETELAEARAALEEAIGGRGQILLLAGEPGIGKTRLAEGIADEARDRGIQVLWGRCWEGEGGAAFWPWVQILRAAVQARSSQQLSTEMGAGAADIAEIVPEVRDKLPDLLEAEPLASDQAQFRFFDSVTTFFRTASRARPQMLLLDDLQSADASSLRLLHFLAGQLEDARIVVIGTYRDAEAAAGSDLSRTLAELSRTGRATRRVDVARFSVAEVAEYIERGEALASTGAIVDLVHTKTEGNPLFVREVVEWLRSHCEEGVDADTIEVPPSLRQVIGRRLDRLSTECRQLLAVASVIGRGFGLRLVARVAEFSEQATVVALSEAEGLRLLEPARGVPGDFRFSHVLVRDTLYEQLPAAQRLRLHQQVGDVLETLHAEQSDAPFAELARHFHEAMATVGAQKVVRYARLAGEQAMKQLAYEEAVVHYRRAVAAHEQDGTDEALRCSLLVALSEALFGSGFTQQAAEECHRAIAMARASGSPRLLAEAGLALGYAHSSADEPREVDLALEEALPGLGEDDRVLRARSLSMLSRNASWSRNLERKLMLAGQALTEARLLGDRIVLWEALEARLEALDDPSGGHERALIGEELLEVARQGKSRWREFISRRRLVLNYLWLADYERTEDQLQACERLAKGLRRSDANAVVLRQRAARALREGRYPEAEALTQKAFSLDKHLDQSAALQGLGAQMFDLRRAQGRLAEVDGPWRRGIESFPALASVTRAGLALIYVESGRPDQARREFERLASDDFNDLLRDFNFSYSIALLAEVAVSLGDLDFELLYELLLRHGQRYVVAADYCSIGCSARYLGLLAEALQRYDDAERHFEDAITVERRMRARPWEAYALHDYARMLLARDSSGDRERAGELATRAREITREIGMTALEAKLVPFVSRGAA